MTHHTSCATFHREKELAVVSLNGVLNLWDVDSGAKKVEFTPASHLTSSFTCLSWKHQHSITAKKRAGTAAKRKSKAMQDDANEQIIALGTATGEIFFYNVKVGDLIGKLEGQHSGKINCVCWDPTDGSLLSCSEDQHIVHWDVTSYKAICKWQGDKRGVSSISVAPHSTLLSAGKMIKLWDLKTKALLRKFTGHANPVFSLACIDLLSKSPSQELETLGKVEGLYFLSSAAEDRIVNVWQVQQKHKKIAIASFSLNSEPISMVVKSPKSREKPVMVMVLTEDGDLNIFSHVLNGQMKKPLDVQMMVTVVDPSAKKLKILAASFVENSDSETATILIAYGTSVKVVFERVNLDDHKEKRVLLNRRDPMKIDPSADMNAMKLKQPIRIKDEMTILAPGLPGHSQNTISSQESETKIKSKRKKATEPALNESEMTMEERGMNALSIQKDNESNKHQPPRADSLCVLLTQGLQSNDKEILNRVLQNTNSNLIHNTITRLPITLVVSLIQDLTMRMRTSPTTAFKFVKWLRETMKVHSSYLMTFPDLVPVLSQLYQVMDSRTATHNRFVKLEGKMDLLSFQYKSKKAETENKVINTTPMLVYEDESSDEQEDVLLDDLPEDHSDSSDASANEWDDLNDMDLDDKDGMIIDEDETDSGVVNGVMEED